jgi:hypothetical protein
MAAKDLVFGGVTNFGVNPITTGGIVCEDAALDIIASQCYVNAPASRAVGGTSPNVEFWLTPAVRPGAADPDTIQWTLRACGETTGANNNGELAFYSTKVGVSGSGDAIVCHKPYFPGGGGIANTVSLNFTAKDADRAGTITSAGAGTQTVACTSTVPASSTTVASRLLLSLVGTTNAGGLAA